MVIVWILLIGEAAPKLRRFVRVKVCQASMCDDRSLIYLHSTQVQKSWHQYSLFGKTLPPIATETNSYIRMRILGYLALLFGLLRDAKRVARAFSPLGLPTTTSRSASSLQSSSSSSTQQQQEASSSSSSSTTTTLGAPVCVYHQVTIPTSQEGPPRQAISVEDLTPIVLDLLSSTGLQQGVVNIISRHTTTAIAINERESRLFADMAKHLLQLVPPDERSSSPEAAPGVRYFHNDIDQRPDSEQEAQRCRENGWDIDDPKQLQAWRDQEPINAHSHLISMLVGSSESIPVVNGELVIGQWQSILLVDLDGPRDRTVGIQLMGYQ